MSLSPKTLQENLNLLFLKACSTKNIELLEKLNKNNPPLPTDTSLEQETSDTSKPFKPFLDPHCENGEAFATACRRGNTEVVRFLISLPSFVDTINENEKIIYGIGEAIAQNNIEVAKTLVPLVKNQEDLLSYGISQGFEDACMDGHLDAVKFCTQFLSAHDLNQLLNTSLNSFQSDGFVNACEQGHVDIVNYLVRSPQIPFHINLDAISGPIKIANPDVMRFFIFDLDIQEDGELIKKLTFAKPEVAQDLFNKRKLFHELNAKVSENETGKAIQSSKPKL